MHALVVHGDAVADADDVELQGHSPALPHPELHLLGEGVQMHVAGDQLVVGVGDADERPVGVVAAHPERAQERTVRRAGGTGEDALTGALQDRLLKIGCDAVVR